MAFKSWHGYTRETAEQYMYWQSVSALLRIDGAISDLNWIATREAELSEQVTADDPAGAYIWRYGRARLEDYCRHQGKFPDGRSAVMLPVYGLENNELLSSLGIEVDNYTHDNVRYDSGDNYIAVLPTSWTFRPSVEAADAELANTPNSERWAAVYDQDGKSRVSVYYCHKPFGFDDGFRSRAYVNEG
jgi:hypothetical protein